MRDICRAAEVNLAAINYHFGDKAGLYREVVQAAIDAIRGTTEAARREGAGLPAAKRLQVFLRTFVRRLLASGQPRVQRLVQREMYEPSGLLDRLVAEAIRPRLEYVAAIVAELLALPRRRPAGPALRHEHSVAGVRRRPEPDRRPARLRSDAEGRRGDRRPHHPLLARRDPGARALRSPAAAPLRARLIGPGVMARFLRAAACRTS